MNTCRTPFFSWSFVLVHASSHCFTVSIWCSRVAKNPAHAGVSVRICFPLEDDGEPLMVFTPARGVIQHVERGCRVQTQGHQLHDPGRRHRAHGDFQSGGTAEGRWMFRDCRCSNRSEGVSMLLDNSRMQAQLVMLVFDTTTLSLQGRVGALRVQRSKDDITAIVMYWLPKLSRRIGPRLSTT